MYTDTSCPNHLIQEVLDNAVDEALAGHCSQIKINLFKDGFIEVSDDGRGMPTDVHPEHEVSGVELFYASSMLEQNFWRGLQLFRASWSRCICCERLINKFISNDKGDGKIHEMSFSGGEKSNELKVTGEVSNRNTGTSIRFIPDSQYFESSKVDVKKLKHLLKAKSVLCPGLKISFSSEFKKDDKETWEYPNGLEGYLGDEIKDEEFLLKDSILFKI